MSNGDWGELQGGWGGRASPSMPCYIARSWEGEHTLAAHTAVLRDGGTDACPQCQGLACFLSLTAPPTASSYITPSPSPGPLPAFIGLFLSFSTLAFSPHWLLPFPPISHRWFLLSNSSSFFLFQRRYSWTEDVNAGLDMCWTEFLCGAHSHVTAREQGSFERTGPDRSGVVYPWTGLFRQHNIPTWITMQSKRIFHHVDTPLVHSKLAIEQIWWRWAVEELVVMESKISM